MRHLSEVTARKGVRIIEVNVTGGAFFIYRNPTDAVLKVIASDGYGWDHVSVSTRHRTPTWDEMDYIKRMFFKDDETVIQYHVPPDDNISYAKHCLHLWRPQNTEVQRPPAWMVGPAVGGDNK